jgi:hypothetical protein
LAALRQHDARLRLDELSGHLGPEYERIFHETFKPRGDGSSVPEWIRLIFDLPISLVLTTNYTCELEQTARFHPSSPLGTLYTPVRWHDGASLTHALRRMGDRIELVYLHGRYDDSPRIEYGAEGRPWSRVILGEKSYTFAYDFPGILRQRISALGQLFTFLIIGASLRDEDITGAFRFIRSLATADSHPHYAVLPLRPSENPDLISDSLRERFGICPIFYPVSCRTGIEDHSAIEGLLRRLVDLTHTRFPTHNPASGRPPQLDSHQVSVPHIVHPLLRAEDFVPRPLYQRALDHFLRAEQGGIMALVGIGGAGKTALVRQATDTLVSEWAQLQPMHLVVWSFYDEPDSRAFFLSSAKYLNSAFEGSESELSAYESIKASIRNGKKVVFILDGLERLQIELPNQLSVHGALESPVLRHFLLWLCASRPSSRAVITTRFPLPDLVAETSLGAALVLDIDALTRPQARSLLRKRGVDGTRQEMDLILDHFGAHALTVDHLGGVIHSYLGGRAARFRELGEGPLTRFEVGQAGAKLARVLKAYDGYLARSEPEVRDTLQRIAIFPRPVSVEALARVFLKPHRLDRAGTLARKSEIDLSKYVRRLVSLRFLRVETNNREPVYSLHPAVRDAVISGIGAQKRALAGTARREYEDYVRVEGKARSVTDDPETLAFVEDLIGFCVDEGDLMAAYQFYKSRLGGYKNMSSIGEYHRLARVAQRILDASAVDARLEPGERFGLTCEFGVTLASLGRVTEARDCLSVVADSKLWPGRAIAASLCFSDLAEVECLAGGFRAGKKAALEARTLSGQDVGGGEATAAACSRLARAQFWLGDVKDAFRSFSESLGAQLAAGAGTVPVLHSLRGFDFQIALLRIGRAWDALAQSAICSLVHRRNRWADDMTRSRLVQAEALRQLGNLREASAFLDLAYFWATASDEHELLLWARLIRARLLRDQGKKNSAADECSEGLRVASVCGYGLFRLEFLNLLADILADSDWNAAAEYAFEAIAIAETGATYSAWGHLAALEVLAMAPKNAVVHQGKLNALHTATEVRRKLQVPDKAFVTLLSTTARVGDDPVVSEAFARINAAQKRHLEVFWDDEVKTSGKRFV